ncbi:MAG TPA: hypothetical protein DEB06_04770, partial [Phycisphaerales bacterium]|nr:hypothetical protein [Phycisphaerales bacterium]
MKLIGPHNTLLPLTTALGALAYAVSEENLLLFLVAVPVILAARLLSPPLSPRVVFPQWAIYGAVLGATGYMFHSWTRAGIGDSIVVLCRYLLALQLIKLFDNRASRDQMQVIALSVMLVVGACLTSVSADLGAVLLLYFPVLAATVV